MAGALAWAGRTRFGASICRTRSCNPWAESDRRFTLDLRRAVLMPITEEFARAQAEGPPPEAEGASQPPQNDTDGIPF